ncbi:MAG TPA: L-aspartate oxidase [Bdellovibrionales bacterium]|nr:L-aspartate oxidase [Bdellovibrionales bacterium]
MFERCDFLVIGSGLAGLAYALKVADRGKVVILSKTSAPQTNTSMAQGGIAAVMAPDDSFESHIRDTLTAGAGLCNEDVVRNVVENAPSRIEDLLKWGVRFDVRDKAGENLDLTREGGHSHRRILHVQDHTGQEIHEHLLNLVRAHPNIEIREHMFAIDLILDRDSKPSSVAPPRCTGAFAFDRKNNVTIGFFARFTLLATGGAGKTYLYTSNWSGATGDGIAMAYRAGARIANLEFMQFHPTCLYHPSARNFLITEAMRGEGGELINSEGSAFTKAMHPLGSLAPRDIVARSIDAEMKRTGAPCVYLDVRHKSATELRDRFPVIYGKCLEYGIDITKDPIPVVPAAHYLCGGVLTDANGLTDIAGLLATGETACTGLHGANRLASNSLLECLVLSHNAARFSLAHMSEFSIPTGLEGDSGPADEYDEDEMIVISHVWEEIRRLMWNYVGIVRSNRRLERAQKRLTTIMNEVSDYYGALKIHPDIIELRNIALVADLTVRCALARQESRGIHYNIDYPDMDRSTQPRNSIIPTRGFNH